MLTATFVRRPPWRHADRGRRRHRRLGQLAEEWRHLGDGGAITLDFQRPAR